MSFSRGLRSKKRLYPFSLFPAGRSALLPVRDVCVYVPREEKIFWFLMGAGVAVYSDFAVI